MRDLSNQDAKKRKVWEKTPGSGMFRRRAFRLVPGLPALLVPALVLYLALLPGSVTSPVRAENGTDLVNTPETAEGPSAQMRMEVQAGWNGLARYNTWLPVVVELENRGPAVEGLVEVVLLGGAPPGMEPPPVLSYAREVPMPASASKKVTMFVLSYGPGDMKVRYSTGDRVLAAVRPTVKTWGAEVPLIGVLSEQPAAFESISRASLPGQDLPRYPQVASLDPDSFPDWGGYLVGLDFIIMDDFDPALLNPAQRRAILEWAEDGGNLVIGTGPGGTSALDLFPDDRKPARAAGTRFLNGAAALEAFGGQTLPLGQALPVALLDAPESKTVVGDPALPLVLQVGWGEGKVWLLAFDPVLEPFRSWPGRVQFWENVLEQARPGDLGDWEKGMGLPPYWRKGSGQMEQLSDTAQYLPGDALPPSSTLILIFLAYLIVVGPINHLVLARFDRRELTWVTIPVLVLLFAGGTYFVGFLGQGRDVIINAVSYIDLEPKKDKIRQVTSVGFYAPTKETFNIEINSGRPVQPLMNYSYYEPLFGPAEEAPVQVVQARETVLTFGPPTRWGVRGFATSRGAEAPGEIMADLRVDGTTLEGSIRNALPYPLKEVVVVMGGEIAELGTVGVGEEKPVRLVLTSPQSGKPRQGPPALETFFNPGWDPVSGRRREVELDAYRRRRLLRAVLETSGPGMRGWGEMETFGMPLTVFAWTEAPTDELGFAAGRSKPRWLTVIRQPLRLSLPPGPFSVARGLVPPQLVEMNTMEWGRSGYDEMSIVKGYLVFEFRLPLEASARVEHIVLDVEKPGLQTAGQAGGVMVGERISPPSPSNVPTPQPQSGTGPGAPESLPEGTFQIYNWRTGAWDLLPEDRRQEFDEDDLRFYLSDDRALWFKISAWGKEIRFRLPSIEVTGVMAGD